MREILPGVFHWSVFHEGIQTDVSSYYLREAGVLIDPMIPPAGPNGAADGIEWLAENGPPADVLLSNRHHYRHSAQLIEAFGVTVHASRPGMHEFGPNAGVLPFEFGDQLSGGVVAHEVGAICPDETALEVGAAGAILIADGLIRPGGGGRLAFVPDELMGDDADRVKRGLRRAFARLLELDFDHLLLAHGLPVLDDGKDALRGFVAETDS